MEAPHFNFMCSVKPLEARTLIMMERGGWAYSGGSPLLYFITSTDVMIHCCEQTAGFQGVTCHTFQKQKEHHSICYGRVQHYAAIRRY